jgi:hypothetical protein
MPPLGAHRTVETAGFKHLCRFYTFFFGYRTAIYPS